MVTTNYTCKPIGFVENGLSKTRHNSSSSRYETVSRIRILDEYAPGLEGLDDFSHVIIVWWMHQAEHVVLKVNVEGLTDDDRSVGIFATRFPARVNPIALSVVELIGIEGCFLNVRGFDGWNDTPVLDIKPYDYYDMVKSPKVPEWFANFWQEHKQKRRYTETVGWLGP